jgi:uncharacterized protein (TIGR00297 family)
MVIPEVVLLAGALLAGAVSLGAWRARAMTPGGAAAATLVGALVLAGGGWVSGSLLVVFFITSTLLSRTGPASVSDRVTRKGSRRDAVQVVANGGIAALCGALAIVDPGRAFPWTVALAGSIAAVTADTWATEIGRRSRSIPRSILSGAPVARGTSGGVTALGTAGSIAGAVLIACCAAAGALAAGSTISPARLAAAVALAGIAGSLVDSLLGASLQALFRCPRCGMVSERPTDGCGQPGTLIKGWAFVNNDAVNLAAAASGALVGLLLAIV